MPPGFGTIWTAVAIDLVGFGIVLPILPLYAEDFGASPTTVGILVASFSVMQLLFAPLWGRLSDRIGRKPVLVLSLVGTAVGSLLTGLAGSLWLLFAGRIIDGISGASVSVAQAAVTDVAPPDQRPRLLGMLGAAFGIGFVAGPALGAFAALGGPKLPFLLAAAIAAVNAVMAMRRLPETYPPGERRPGATHVPGVAVGALNPVLVRLLATAFVAMVAFSAFEATFALLGEVRFGLGLAGTGGVFALVGIALAVVQGGLVHPVVHRYGEVATLRGGLAANAVGLVVLAGAESWPVLAAALLCLVVGQGLLSPSLSSLVVGRAHPDRRGAVLGTQQSVGGMARVIGPLAGGALFDHVGTPAPYLLGAGLVALALCLLSLERRQELEQTAS